MEKNASLVRQGASFAGGGLIEWLGSMCRGWRA